MPILKVIGKLMRAMLFKKLEGKNNLWVEIGGVFDVLFQRVGKDKGGGCSMNKMVGV